MTSSPRKKESCFKSFFSGDKPLFLFQFFRHPQTIGAVAPSSKALADAMTRHINNPDPQNFSKNYLEVGAGTGAFTDTLIQKLGPLDSLDIVEINPSFCELLQKKYHGNTQIKIHSLSILDWKPSYLYDGIVSSLPFNAFRTEHIRAILNHYKELLNKRGTLTYCEYMALPRIKRLFLSSEKKKVLEEALLETTLFEKEHEIGKEKIFANFPPAMVHHCRL